MTQAEILNYRAHYVADVVNAHLPEERRSAILEEEMSVLPLLETHGLAARKILVVGGGGYIGSVLCGHLLSRGYSVRNLDLLLYGNEASVLPYLGLPGYEFMRGDLSDEKLFEAALDGVTDVVLLAGLVGDPVTKTYPEAAARINDEGHELMLKALSRRKLNKVVFVSTCSNYGMVEGDVLANEDWELKPLSLYAQSKVRMEQKLLSQKGSVDYTPTILRFATAFGLSPRMRFDLTVSEFTRALALGEDLLVYDAHTWRPYCHVQDFCEVIRRVLEAPKVLVAFDVFNAGGEVNNFTKQMIINTVLEQLPGASVRYQEHGSDPRNYRVSFAKINQRLGFTPKWTVCDGVSELLKAMGQGLFRDISHPESFHGNWVVNYRV